MGQHQLDRKNKKGYVMLISMIIIGAVGTSVITSSLLLGTGYSKTSIALEQSQKARMLANSCTEKALGEVWLLDSYEGSASLNFSEGSCEYSVSGLGEIKTINSEGVFGASVKKIIVGVDQLHPYVNISSWQEIP